MINKESQRRKIDGSKKESRSRQRKTERESKRYVKKDRGERQKVEDREIRTQEKTD